MVSIVNFFGSDDIGELGVEPFVLKSESGRDSRCLRATTLDAQRIDDLQHVRRGKRHSTYPLMRVE